MVFCKTQFPIQLFPRHLFSKEVWLQYYVPTKTTTSNTDFLQEKLLQEYEFQDRKIPKQVETKTFWLQDKTFPWQSNFKSIFCQDMSWKKYVLQIYILERNLFWNLYLGFHILGILFLAKIYVGSCCLGWYIILESNLQMSSSLSWYLLGSVILHLAPLENSLYQSQRPNWKKYINPRNMSGRT